ncbi:hypothetical protein Gotur_010324 [Gossypium turneri]
MELSLDALASNERSGSPLPTELLRATKKEKDEDVHLPLDDEKEITFLEGDVKISLDAPYPQIKISLDAPYPQIYFSERVHNLINKSMKQTNDYNRVLVGGLWMVYDHYLEGLMLALAEVSGRVVKADYNTTDGKRGKFARIAVVVDLSKPLLTTLDEENHQAVIVIDEGLKSTIHRVGQHVRKDIGIQKWIASLSRKLDEHTSQMDNPNGGSLNGLLPSTSSGANEEIEQPMIVAGDMVAENDVEDNDSPDSNL